MAQPQRKPTIGDVVRPFDCHAFRLANDLPATRTRPVRESGAITDYLARSPNRLVRSISSQDQKTERRRARSPLHSDRRGPRSFHVTATLGINVRYLAAVYHSACRHDRKALSAGEPVLLLDDDAIDSRGRGLAVNLGRVLCLVA